MPGRGRRRPRSRRITEDYLIANKRNPVKNINPNPFMFGAGRSRKDMPAPAGSRHDRSAERRRFGAGTAPTPPRKRLGRKRPKRKPLGLGLSARLTHVHAGRTLPGKARSSFHSQSDKFHHIGGRPELKVRGGGMALGRKGGRKRRVNIFGQLGGVPSAKHKRRR